VALFLFSLVGISQLDVHHNPILWLGEDHPTTIGVTMMDAEVGGTATVHVLIESDSELGLKDVDLLHKIEKLDAHMRNYVHPKTGQRIVTDTISILDIVKETNRALHGGDQAHYALPDSQRGVSDALLLFENAGPDELSRIATGDLKKTHLTARVIWLDASSYLPLRSYLNEGIDEIFGDSTKVTATGTVYSLLSVVGVLIEDLLKSFGVAFVAITIMMIALLRDVRLGIVSMAPNLMPVVLVFGIMGFVGIDIDMSNLLIGSIVIGIAVDDTIHYLHQYKQHHLQHNDTEGAIAHALDHAGRALVSTTLILALGFFVYSGSALLSIARFGVLVGLTCLSALLIDLILTPALLRTFFPDDAK